MLTNTSGINYLTGYPAQLDVSNTDRSSKRAESSSLNQKESNDTVNISSKAKELQAEFQRDKTTLERNHDRERQQIEREYLLEKNQLESEYSQKKQSLEISVYA